VEKDGGQRVPEGMWSITLRYFQDLSCPNDGTSAGDRGKVALLTNCLCATEGVTPTSKYCRA
jgi:hypothetical protein